jgi:hypothetical protein
MEEVIECRGSSPDDPPEAAVLTQREVFERWIEAFSASRRLHPREARAAQSIRWCGRRELGAHVLSCPQGHFEELQFHACRHRSCARCARAAQLRWIEAELHRLLPVAHHHVVFTLPHELLPLWEHNRAAFMGVLMRCTRQSLLELLADERHLGAVPGVLQSLHTWGRTLSHHPHVHCLVSAGGIDAQGQWRGTRAGWLMPVKAVQRLYRGKLLAAVRHGVEHGWSIPAWTTPKHWRGVLRRLWHKHWNLEIGQAYDSGKGVAIYLGGYVKGGPLPYERPLHWRDGHIEFSYTDHRDGRRKLLQLTPQEFIGRLLWHAPPRGQHMTRHAGLYSSAWREQHRRALEQLSQSEAVPERPWPRARQPRVPLARACPQCAKSLLRVGRLQALKRSELAAHQGGEISPHEGRVTLNRPAQVRQRGPTRRSSGQPVA